MAASKLLVEIAAVNRPSSRWGLLAGVGAGVIGALAIAAAVVNALAWPWAICIATSGAAAWLCAAALRHVRRSERDLDARMAEWLEASSHRGYRQFVASMTHELRTPIHGVQGIADVIAAGVYGPVTERQIAACAAIKRSAQTLLGLVDDVLNLARAEVDGIEAVPAVIDINELVERVTASVSWMVGTKRIALRTEVQPQLPLVHTDPRWLAHIVINLVSNAVKFTPEGGKVLVSVREAASGRGVVLEIADSGVGIAREDRERIFEPFLQGRDAHDRGYGGVGLGLALVARLSELLACDVELDSTLGQGATFRVTVPYHWQGQAVSRLMRPVTPPPGVIAGITDDDVA